MRLTSLSSSNLRPSFNMGVSFSYITIRDIVSVSNSVMNILNITGMDLNTPLLRNVVNPQVSIILSD